MLNLLIGLAVVGIYNPNFSDEFGTAMSVYVFYLHFLLHVVTFALSCLGRE